jgi:prevent-host-death family protein
MEKVPIRSLNQDTAEVIARVERGEVIEVTNRGRPVARIVPITADEMADLVAAGAARPPTVSGPVPMPAVAAEPEVDSGALISAMRDEERW